MKTRNATKTLAFLLTFAMLISMLAGTVALAADEEAAYRPSTAFTEGMECLVVAETDAGDFALAYDGEALTSAAVTVADGFITLAGKQAVWVADADKTIHNAETPEAYIFAGSHGFMTFTGGRTFEYDAEAKHITMHGGMYYLTFDPTAGKFDESLEEAEAATIQLYEPVPVYTKTDALVEDDQYIIVAETASGPFALAYDGEALGSQAVTVDGETIYNPPADVAWTADADNTIHNVKVPEAYIFAGSHGFMTFTGGRTFEYDAAAKHIAMHGGMYYLTFDPATGKFDESLEESEAATITLYGREMPKIAKEEKFIPDGSDLPEVVRDAVKNDDGSITLAFVSDIHHSTKYDHMNLQVWLDKVSEEVGYIDALGSCGDMGSAYSATNEEYWNNVGAVFDYMDGVVDSGKIGTAIYTFGNHEWYPSAGGDYMNNYENPVAQRLFRVGEAMKTDDYIIYCFGAGDISSRYSQGYSEADIERVAAYLASAPTDIPIFILTHFPIHFWGDRNEENAAKLLEVFNQYPNIVVLWGHNHSDFDENYDALCRPGDTIQVDLQGTMKEINFTYLSAGCISDIEYTGAYEGSAWVQGKGLIVTIEADGSLTFDYYTMDGVPMHEDGPYLVEFRDGVTYTTLKTEFVEAGGAATAPEAPTFDHYTFTGWDYDFDNVTRHMCVTAQYDFNTLRDENYIYLTLTLGTDVVKGRSGKDILFYPIPYAENMTITDAFAALQEAEYPGAETPELAVSNRGFFSKIWGINEEEQPSDLSDRMHGVFALTMTSNDGYVAATDFVKPGLCYYATLFDEAHPQVTTSFLNLEETTVKAGEKVSFVALTWVDRPSYNYWQELLDGDVYVGTSLDALADSGVDAVDGKFELSFDADGTYYVVVKAAGAANAYAIVHVGDAPAAPPTPAKTFTDVDYNSWYAAPVTWATEKGITNGKGSETTFKPGDTVTRAEAVTFLYRLAGEPAVKAEVGPFFDVWADGGLWYTDAVMWAAENGIIEGYNEGAHTIFAPDRPVTREAFAAMLYRYAKLQGKGFTGLWSFELNFPDAGSVSNWALEPISWMVMNEVINGMDGKLEPKGSSTRAQLMKMLYCYANL